MPNPIKYSTSAQTLALKKGNFWIGTGDVGKGPTSTTDYWNGITPPSGGYTIYLNKASGGPSIYTAANDSQLISLSNTIAGQTFASAAAALAWFATQTDKMVFDIDYPAIVTNGLILNLDAGFTPSYPTTGTTWYDVSSGGNNGTLTNGPTFNSANSGSIVFDGTNDYVNLLTSGLVSGWTSLTYNVWVNITQNPSSPFPGFIASQTSIPSLNVAFGSWDTTRTLWYEVDTVNGNYYGGGPGSNTFSLNTWFNVCMVYDGSNVYGYYNNSLDKQFNATGALNTISDLRIANSTGYGFLNGKIAIAQAYNRALTAAEVSQNYNATKSRFGL